jgi:GPI ethanolamine phosphate transferase 1
MAGTGILYMVFERRITSQSRSHKVINPIADPISRAIMGVQIGFIFLAIIVTRSSIASLQAKKGLPLGSQIVGWFTLICSLCLPFVHKLRPNNHYLHRLVVIFLAFSPTFVILTISYEGLFYFAFCTTLITWVHLEHRIYTFFNPTPTLQPTTSNKSPVTTLPNPPSQYRPLTLSDTRTSLIFFYLLQSAFFSTGNIASISSFSLDAVYRLLPIFDPFSQGALLLFKLLVPFAVISAVLGILNLRLGLESSALFMLVMALSDVLTLNFFWMVRDEGSWLDIGTSISHFFIGSLLNVFVAGLEGLSGWFIQGVEVDGYADVDGVVVGVEEEEAEEQVVDGNQGQTVNVVLDGQGEDGNEKSGLWSEASANAAVANGSPS